MKARYQTPLTSTWFMNRPGFRKFMVREATAFFISSYVMFLLVWLYQLMHGEYAVMVEVARNPVSVVFHIVVLLAALYHSITWFNLTPQIMPVFMGEERVPGPFVAIATGYAPWIVLTVIIVWWVLR
jgi:fumarate reductase subunit C